jgi:hypothetical protein
MYFLLLTWQMMRFPEKVEIIPKPKAKEATWVKIKDLLLILNPN